MSSELTYTYRRGDAQIGPLHRMSPGPRLLPDPPRARCGISLPGSRTSDDGHREYLYVHLAPPPGIEPCQICWRTHTQGTTP